MNTELSRVAELADRLANRILVAFEQGALSTEEFRASPDVALVIDAARLLQAAGAEFSSRCGAPCAESGGADAALANSRTALKFVYVIPPARASARLPRRTGEGPWDLLHHNRAR
jgi:hypothetical protein